MKKYYLTKEGEKIQLKNANDLLMCEYSPRICSDPFARVTI